MLTAKFRPALLLALVALAAGSWAVAQNAKEPAKAPEFKLPPGWTEADLQACMLAGTPGKMHQHLAAGVGVWQGKNTLWMFPGAEPMQTECTATVTTFMDGRYVKCEMSGEMPGMGPYKGFGLYGFDNVSGKFVSTWLDNHSTGLMNGTGELSEDGKTLTWQYSMNCPITKKPTVLREVATITSATTKTLEMYGQDPKGGKEFKMMRIELSKK
jgi:hypothetical protein